LSAESTPLRSSGKTLQREGDRVPEGGQEAGGVDEDDRLALTAPVEKVEAKAVRFNEKVTRAWRWQETLPRAPNRPVGGAF
jgi:hypothetical protein